MLGILRPGWSGIPATRAHWSDVAFERGALLAELPNFVDQIDAVLVDYRPMLWP